MGEVQQKVPSVNLEVLREFGHLHFYSLIIDQVYKLETNYNPLEQGSFKP